MNAPWSVIVRAVEVPPTQTVRQLEAGEAERERIRRSLDLPGLEHLSAELQLKPWFDGVEVTGAWEARFTQTCSVTAERLNQTLSGDFTVRVVPEGSIHAPTEEQQLEVDLEAPDPPDVSPDGSVDIADLVVEHFALEIDPFPRKEGVEFAPTEPDPEDSPFAALRRLRRED